MNKAKKSILFLLLVTTLLVIPTLVAFAKELGMLTISGEFEEPQRDDQSKAVVQERYYGSFSRSVTLPESVDSDKVEATYDNGVLTLNLP